MNARTVKIAAAVAAAVAAVTAVAVGLAAGGLVQFGTVFAVFFIVTLGWDVFGSTGEPSRPPAPSNETVSFVYRYFDANGNVLYVGKSNNPSRRDVEHRDSKFWYDEVAAWDVQEFPSERAALRAEYKQIKRLRPVYNIVHNN